MSRKTPVLITVGPLSNRIFAVTRYTKHENGAITAHEKQDVTDQVGAALQDLDSRGLELVPASKEGKQMSPKQQKGTRYVVHQRMPGMRVQ